MRKTKKTSFSLIIFLLLFGILTPHLFNPILVTAQTSYIDVYVYDAITSAPLFGANVMLSDGEHMYLDDDFTDITGHCNFSALEPGDYFVETHPNGYQNNETFVTIEIDGDGELVEFYQELPYTPGDGFIDVYVYDFETLDPIPGAEIAFFNEFGMFITEGIADGIGFFNFTDIGVGTYNIEAWNESYNVGDTIVTIDYDGEAALAELYLTPAYVPGNGFIDVYIYDNITLMPIENAAVLLEDEYGFNIDWILSDATGYVNFTGLGIGDYVVEAAMNNYLRNSSSVYIDYDGEAEYLMLYINPLIRSIDILYPSDSETVEGGLVLVGVDVEDSSQLTTIDVYVNAEFITTLNIYGTLTDFIVPVFENGTNTIYLEAYWNDMSMASTSVVIDSINVIPTVNIKEGDYLNYRQYNLADVTTYDANFTFTTWLSPFEMLTHYTVHQYDSGGTIAQEDIWITVNVLNGYVSNDPSSGMLYGNFFPFGCLPINPVVGDKASWVVWNSLMTVNGSMTWEYTDVWTLDAYFGMMVVYVEKSSNLIHYLEMPGFMEMIILETTIDFLNPYLSDEADFGYDVGDTGNIISWTASDMNPLTYTIYRDAVVIVDSEIWNSEVPIVLDVDGLAEGTYTYTIVVKDLAGNIAEDTVIVTTTPLIPEFNIVLGILFLPAIICIKLVLVQRKKKISNI